MELHNSVALVTTSKRIGAAVAIAMAKAGADVAIVSRHSQSEAETTAAAIREFGRRALVISADLTQPDDCSRVVNSTVEAFGRLNVLVNIASVFRRMPPESVTVADWDEQMNVDVRAAWLCARAAAPFMREQGGGRIINFADWSAVSGRPRSRNHLPYHVAKAATIALTQALALELAPDQILVNAIAPGPIVPPSGSSVEHIESVAKATPLGRWAGELEVAKLVLALIQSDFITGEAIRLDGGRHLS